MRGVGRFREREMKRVRIVRGADTDIPRVLQRNAILPIISPAKLYGFSTNIDSANRNKR